MLRNSQRAASEMAKGSRPYDKDVAVRSAKFVNELIEMPWDGFAPGSDTGAKTAAKPEIWKDRAEFDRLGPVSVRIV